MGEKFPTTARVRIWAPSATLAPIKTVEKWLWRIRWAGRWTTTRTHFTEAEIRREHPEAERDDASRILVEVPDTDQERSAAQQPRGGR